MRISQREWNNYIKTMRRLNDQAVKDFTSFVVKNGGYANIERQVLIDYAYGIATKYGEASAALSAEMYDAVATLQRAAVPAAIPAESVTYEKVCKTVNGIIKNTASQEILVQSVGLLVKDSGQKTTIENAKRDNAEIAFINDGDACAFCVMLASKGWRKASTYELDSDGEPAHLHANCGCTYGVRFNPKLDYSGYKPEQYQKMYYGADLEGEEPTAKNRLNALRRELNRRNTDNESEE